LLHCSALPDTLTRARVNASAKISCIRARMHFKVLSSAFRL
jgi:hypothetical protein